jgi:cytochrome c peroxidase
MNLDLTKLSCVCVGAILELTTSTGFANPLPSADVDFPEINPPQIALGQLLFFDPIFSGNKSISCATFIT